MVGGVNGVRVGTVRLLPDVVVGCGVAAPALFDDDGSVDVLLPPPSDTSGVAGVDVACVPAPPPPPPDVPPDAAEPLTPPALRAVNSRSCLICSGVGVALRAESTGSPP